MSVFKYYKNKSNFTIPRSVKIVQLLNCQNVKHRGLEVAVLFNSTINSKNIEMIHNVSDKITESEYIENFDGSNMQRIKSKKIKNLKFMGNIFSDLTNVELDGLILKSDQIYFDPSIVKFDRLESLFIGGSIKVQGNIVDHLHVQQGATAYIDVKIIMNCVGNIEGKVDYIFSEGYDHIKQEKKYLVKVENQTGKIDPEEFLIFQVVNSDVEFDSDVWCIFSENSKIQAKDVNKVKLINSQISAKNIEMLTTCPDSEHEANIKMYIGPCKTLKSARWATVLDSGDISGVENLHIEKFGVYNLTNVKNLSLTKNSLRSNIKSKTKFENVQISGIDITEEFNETLEYSTSN